MKHIVEDRDRENVSVLLKTLNNDETVRKVSDANELYTLCS